MNSLPIQNNSLENSSFYPAIGLTSDLVTLPVAGALVLIGACYKTNFNPSIAEIRSNKKPVVVCLHGNGFNEMQWLFFQYMLKDKYNIVTWNLDGLLSNDPNKSIQNYADMHTEKTVNLCKLTDQRKVVFVGHSMGGLISALSAQDIAKKHPDIHVRGVIDISTPSIENSLLNLATRVTQRIIPSIFQDPIRYRQMRGEDPTVSEIKAGIASSQTPHFSICSDGDLIAGKGGALSSTVYHHSFLGHYTPMVSSLVCKEVDEIIEKKLT